MKNVMRSAALLIVVLAASISSSCATAPVVIHDVESCAGPELKPIEADVIKAAEEVLVCGVVSGGQLPACALSGLHVLAVALGPNGEAFLDCVIPKIEADLSKPANVREAAHSYRAARARGVRLVGPPR